MDSRGEGDCPECGERRRTYYMSDCISTASGWDTHVRTGLHECSSKDETPTMVERTEQVVELGRAAMTPEVLSMLDTLLGQIKTHRHLYGLTFTWQKCDQCLEVAGYLVEVIRMDQPRAAHQKEMNDAE